MSPTASATPDFARWRNDLLERGIKPRIADYWSSLARVHVRIEPDHDRQSGKRAGISRFFGTPHLMSGIRPARDEPGLELLAQIDLEEIAPSGAGLPLPCSGMLEFYYDTVRQPWGFDPKDRDGFLVRYVEDAASGAQPGQLACPSVGLRFSRAECLPDYFQFLDRLQNSPDFTADEIDEFSFAVDDEFLEGEELAGHRIGGWPGAIQNPMELQCQLVSSGIYLGSGDGRASERARELAPGADDWRLLLQLDSAEDELGWLWGDDGMLYFWCREQDIADLRFDRAWLILQCY